VRQRAATKPRREESGEATGDEVLNACALSLELSALFVFPSCVFPVRFKVSGENRQSTKIKVPSTDSDYLNCHK